MPVEPSQAGFQATPDFQLREEGRKRSQLRRRTLKFENVIPTLGVEPERSNI
jgi:hypothetical protein